MTDVWQRCRGHNDGILAPLDLVDHIYLWAAGEAAIAAEAVAALAAPILDIPLVVGSGAVVPAWVGGATLSIMVDRQGDGAGGGLVEELIARGGAVIGLTADEGLAEVLTAAAHTVLDMPPDEETVVQPIVVPLLEALDMDDVVDDLAGWTGPESWLDTQAGLPVTLARAVAAAEVPAVYGGEGIGAVAAAWMAAQARLFTGRPAIGASFGDALTHMPAWSTGDSLTPVAWLVTNDREAAVATAFDRAVQGVRAIRCTSTTPGAQLAELMALADLAVSALPRRE